MPRGRKNCPVPPVSCRRFGHSSETFPPACGLVAQLHQLRRGTRCQLSRIQGYFEQLDTLPMKILVSLRTLAGGRDVQTRQDDKTANDHKQWPRPLILAMDKVKPPLVPKPKKIIFSPIPSTSTPSASEAVPVSRDAYLLSPR